jgi:hypothetical protein
LFEVDRSEHNISSEGHVKKTVERESSPIGQVIGIDLFPNWTAKITETGIFGNRIAISNWKRIVTTDKG